MSVVQVKKRFAEMEAHLGKDKESMKKLKLLKDDVNVLRTSLASAKEGEQRAIETAEVLRKKADDAEAKAQQAVLECERLKSIVSSLSSRVSILERDEDSDDADDKNGDAFDVKRVLKALLKSVPHCPVPTVFVSNCERWGSYLREDFSTGWSRKDLWTLGASVAITSALHGAITVVSKQRFASDDSQSMQPTRIGISVGKLGSPGYIGKQLLQWLGEKHLDKEINELQSLQDDPDALDELYLRVALALRSVNQGPSAIKEQ